VKKPEYYFVTFGRAETSAVTSQIKACNNGRNSDTVLPSSSYTFCI